MKNLKLRRLAFMALCCDMGIFGKKLIAPAADLITDALHIPGGIGSAFSLFFIVLAAAFADGFGTGTLMGAVQSILALCMGTTGSMGALAPVGYILPGLAVDLVLLICRRTGSGRSMGMVFANASASLMAALAADCIVFHLRGAVLALYLGVAAVSGAVCGVLAAACAKKLEPVFKQKVGHAKTEREKCREGAAI